MYANEAELVNKHPPLRWLVPSFSFLTVYNFERIGQKNNQNQGHYNTFVGLNSIIYS